MSKIEYLNLDSVTKGKQIKNDVEILGLNITGCPAVAVLWTFFLFFKSQINVVNLVFSKCL